MENKSLLKYELSSEVTAFSTTRLSPFNLSGDEINQMGAYAAFNVTHYCGDDKGRVERNRAWLCEELGFQRRTYGYQDRHIPLMSAV